MILNQAVGSTKDDFVHHMYVVLGSIKYVLARMDRIF